MKKQAVLYCLILFSQIQIPWSLFFDVASINKFVPVMELADYLRLQGRILDVVYYLQGYKVP